MACNGSMLESGLVGSRDYVDRFTIGIIQSTMSTYSQGIVLLGVRYTLDEVRPACHNR